MIEAKVVCDSVSPDNIRLTTMQLRYPKFIHGEFMTHRVFSRNASSSRAIPTAKLIEEIRSDALRAAPVFWGKNQSGMQAAEELDNINKIPGMDVTRKECAQNVWADASQVAADRAERLLALGVHKQIVNRLLEPFSHINVVVTATEWDNFFGLRLHKDAQPEMRALAVAMWEVRKASEPKALEPDDWHLPFVDTGRWDDTVKSFEEAAGEDGSPIFSASIRRHEDFDKLAIKVSVARCARVSYLSFETGKRSTIEEDLKLYDRLMSQQPLHASPAEHQATPDENKGFWEVIDGNNGSSEGTQGWQNTAQWGNFKGWRQYRKMLPNESIAPLPPEYS